MVRVRVRVRVSASEFWLESEKADTTTGIP